MRKPELSEFEGRIGYTPTHNYERIMLSSGPHEVGTYLGADALSGIDEDAPFGTEAEETGAGVEIVVKDHNCPGVDECEIEFIEYPVCHYNEQHERDGEPAMYRAAFRYGGGNPTTYEYACEECAQVHGIEQCEEYKSY